MFTICFDFILFVYEYNLHLLYTMSNFYFKINLGPIIFTCINGDEYKGRNSQIKWCDIKSLKAGNP